MWHIRAILFVRIRSFNSSIVGSIKFIDFRLLNNSNIIELKNINLHIFLAQYCNMVCMYYYNLYSYSI